MKKKAFGVMIVLLVAIGFGALSLFLSSEAYYIPASFMRARAQGAQSAQTISVIINDSLKTLSEVGAYERRGDLSSSVYLIRGEINKTADRQKQAQELAAAMEQMARAIPEIKPASAQQVALEAVSAQVAAVSHLITYNEYLTDLFNLLNERVRGNKEATTERVQQLVGKLNAESNMMNSLNTQFGRSLTTFDSIFDNNPRTGR